MSEDNDNKAPVLEPGETFEGLGSLPSKVRLGEGFEGESFDEALKRREREENAILRASKRIADKYGFSLMQAREILLSGN